MEPTRRRRDERLPIQSSTYRRRIHLTIHPETDEALLVLEGTLRIDLPDGPVYVAPGEFYMVPRGVEHRTAAEGEAKLMMLEPRIS
jgi:mannose-6-phosphate isomerase-like protein (cupin superfamily)